MNKIDFIELAKYCQSQCMQKHCTRDNRYLGTLFISIIDDIVKTSMTPHILKDAQKCLLIHKWEEIAQRWPYDWYQVEFFGKDGCVTDGKIDDTFKIKVDHYNGLDNNLIYLFSNDKELLRCGTPFDLNIRKVWELYTKVRDVKDEEERKAIAKEFQKTL